MAASINFSGPRPQKFGQQIQNRPCLHKSDLPVTKKDGGRRGRYSGMSRGVFLATIPDSIVMIEVMIDQIIDEAWDKSGIDVFRSFGEFNNESRPGCVGNPGYVPLPPDPVLSGHFLPQSDK